MREAPPAWKVSWSGRVLLLRSGHDGLLSACLGDGVDRERVGWGTAMRAVALRKCWGRCIRMEEAFGRLGVRRKVQLVLVRGGVCLEAGEVEAGGCDVVLSRGPLVLKTKLEGTVRGACTSKTSTDFNKFNYGRIVIAPTMTLTLTQPWILLLTFLYNLMAPCICNLGAENRATTISMLLDFTANED